VSNEGEPGRSSGVMFRSIMAGENPSNNVFVEWDVESQGNLLSNAGTALGGIPMFCLDNGCDEVIERSLWTRLLPSL
jgi:hypothetical protein